jgi:hypothetical protein
VLSVSMLLLSRLQARRLENYDALRRFTRKSVPGGDVLFLPALNLLYLLGVVEYRPKTDAFEYVRTQ